MSAPPDRLGAGRTADVLVHSPGTVLKQFRAGYPAEAAASEVQAARAARAAGLPVPAVLGTVEVGGTHSIVFERIDGPSMLARLLQQPWRLGAHAASLAALHLKIHRARTVGLVDALERLRCDLQSLPVGDELRVGALERLGWLPGGDALCHFDFHPANVLLSTGGPYVIDWPNAALGPPAADVARTVLLLRHAQTPVRGIRGQLSSALRDRFCDAYLTAYADVDPVTVAAADAYLPLLALARLGEDVPGERTTLLALASKLLPVA